MESSLSAAVEVPTPQRMTYKHNAGPAVPSDLLVATSVTGTLTGARQLACFLVSAQLRKFLRGGEASLPKAMQDCCQGSRGIPSLDHGNSPPGVTAIERRLGRRVQGGAGWCWGFRRRSGHRSRVWTS